MSRKFHISDPAFTAISCHYRVEDTDQDTDQDALMQTPSPSPPSSRDMPSSLWRPAQSLSRPASFKFPSFIFGQLRSSLMSDSSIPTLPPRGQVLLVTDELASPADFILYRSLTAHFKAAGKSTSAKCLVVSVSGNLAKWKAVLAKSVRFE